MAGKPQKNLAYSVLLDFYGPALTEKQRAILVPNIMTRIFPLPRLPRISALPARVCGTPSSMAKPPWMSWKRSWVTPAATHRCRKTSPGCTNWSWRIRCCNSGLFNPVPRIRTDTDEMLKIIERLDAQEGPDGV